MEVMLDYIPDELIELILIELKTSSKNLIRLGDRYKCLYENFVNKIKKGLYDPIIVFKTIDDTSCIYIIMEILYEITWQGDSTNIIIFGEHCTSIIRERILGDLHDIVGKLQYLFLNFYDDKFTYMIFQTSKEYVFIYIYQIENDGYCYDIKKSDNSKDFYNNILTDGAREMLLEFNGYN